MGIKVSAPTGHRLDYEGGENIRVHASLPVGGSAWTVHSAGNDFTLPASTGQIRRLVQHLGELQEKPAGLRVAQLSNTNPDHISRKWRATDPTYGKDATFEFFPNKPYTGVGGHRGFWKDDGKTWGGTNPSVAGPFEEIL